MASQVSGSAAAAFVNCTVKKSKVMWLKSIALKWSLMNKWEQTLPTSYQLSIINYQLSKAKYFGSRALKGGSINKWVGGKHQTLPKKLIIEMEIGLIMFLFQGPFHSNAHE